MCAYLGITHIYAHPYHHQANGRAERAGDKIRELLRKFNADEHKNWVELLPEALKVLHDTPGESGLSPYEILFGRERFTANIPFEPPRECEDALLFFERMEDQEEEVAQILNKLHEDEAARINSRRKKLPALPIGAKVWYGRPEGTGTKNDTRWIGPAEVLSREGEDSYTISMGPNSDITAHRTYLKEHWEDTCNDRPVPMFWHKRTVKFPMERSTRPRIKRILGHVVDENGNVYFTVHKEGEDVLSAEELPVKDFVCPETQQLVKYCRENRLDSLLGIFGDV